MSPLVFYALAHPTQDAWRSRSMSQALRLAYGALLAFFCSLLELRLCYPPSDLRRLLTFTSAGSSSASLTSRSTVLGELPKEDWKKEKRPAPGLRRSSLQHRSLCLMPGAPGPCHDVTGAPPRLILMPGAPRTCHGHTRLANRTLLSFLPLCSSCVYAILSIDNTGRVTKGRLEKRKKKEKTPAPGLRRSTLRHRTLRLMPGAAGTCHGRSA